MAKRDLTPQERQELVWAHRELLKFFGGSNRKLAKATHEHWDNGWHHSALSRITPTSGGSVDVLERFREMLVHRGVLKHAELLQRQDRRLRDLPKFAERLAEAKQMGPDYPPRCWERVGDQLANTEQQEASVLNILNAVQFIASGLPSRSKKQK